MELFYAYKITDDFAWLDADESAHCVRILRHRVGDEIAVIGGNFPTAPGKGSVRAPQGMPGTDIACPKASAAIYHCIITDDSPKEVVARVESVQEGWGSHPYFLRMAVCPTKNIDRYEWFVEKAVELGVDEIVPVIGEHSERRVLRTDRLRRIAVSAAKQSLKGAVPVIAEAIPMLEFLAEMSAAAGFDDSADQNACSAPQELRLIAYCSDDVAPRGSIMDVLGATAFSSATGKGQVRDPENGSRYLHSPSAGPLHAIVPQITVLIGPEGDFSRGEVQAAMNAGFIPVHLGSSRLRTETAAVTAVEAVYFMLGSSVSSYDSAASVDSQPAKGGNLVSEREMQDSDS